MSASENYGNLLGNIKIKVERVTPPRSTPTPEPPNVSALIKQDESLSMFRKILFDEPIEAKPLMEPIKSSTEILAELFQVFNAPPPEMDGVDTKQSKHSKKSKKAKKKHKKEKKSERKSKKKHKKHKKGEKNEKGDVKSGGGSSSSTDSESENVAEQQIKVGKPEEDAPKRKASDKDIEAMPAKRRRRSKSKEPQPEPSTVEQKDSAKNDKNVKETGAKTESTASSGNKIKIKNLSDSTVYRDTIKQVEENEKQKERDKERTTRDKERRRQRHHAKKRSKRANEEAANKSDGGESAFTISDEETYLREYEHAESRDHHRNRFYGVDLNRRSSDRDKERTHRTHGSRHNNDRASDRDYVKHDDRSNSSRQRQHGTRQDHRHDMDRRR